MVRAAADTRALKTSKGDRWFRAEGPAFAVALLLLIIAGGTAGYVIVERWGWWDAFYMTIITVTTVGYGYPHTLSRAGELLTVGWQAKLGTSYLPYDPDDERPSDT